MTYIVIAELLAKDEPEAIQRVKEALEEATPIYIKEAGTLQWIPTQDNTDPRAFLLFESFESEAAFKAHNEHPHRPKFLAAIMDNIAGPPQFKYLTPLAS